MSVQATLKQIKNGWAAVGEGWAVHAPTKEEALREYSRAEQRHREIEQQPYAYERKSKSVVR